MWLARLFGGRKAEEAEDEPARFAPPPARPVRPAKGSSGVGSPTRGIHADKVANKVKSGFDPYNSGSFERNKAWERVIR